MGIIVPHTYLVESAAPTTEPVSAAELRTHMREDLDDSVNNAYIETLITVARRYVEARTNRSFVSTTWALYLDEFADVIYLPRSPVSSVTSIQYVDTTGTTQTLSSTLYRTDLFSQPARITTAYGTVWPVPQGVTNAVIVTFVSAYTTVPAEAKHAIKLLASHWYAQREQVVSGTIVTPIPMQADALIGILSDGGIL